MKIALLNDPAWTQRYESLRRHFLGEAGRLQSAPLGFLLFLRQGLAGWMGSWNQPPPVSAPLPEGPSPMRPLAAPSGWQRQLTCLLAQIATVHL